MTDRVEKTVYSPVKAIKPLLDGISASEREWQARLYRESEQDLGALFRGLKAALLADEGVKRD